MEGSEFTVSYTANFARMIDDNVSKQKPHSTDSQHTVVESPVTVLLLCFVVCTLPGAWGPANNNNDNTRHCYRVSQVHYTGSCHHTCLLRRGEPRQANAGGVAGVAHKAVAQNRVQPQLLDVGLRLSGAEESRYPPSGPAGSNQQHLVVVS